MAKKSSGGSSYNKLAGYLALISLFVTGICYLINLILRLCGGSINLGILMVIANIFMIVAIVMISWKALKSAHLPCKTVWIVLYWVLVILAIVGQYSLL